MNTPIKPKLQRFQTATAFACPICQLDLELVGTSFKCPKGHSFDLAKFGYVNLAPQIKQSKDYDKENFQNRQLILEAGFYEPILTAIGQKIPTSDARILDRLRRRLLLPKTTRSLSRSYFLCIRSFQGICATSCQE